MSETSKGIHKLPVEAKVYIVRALACRERPVPILKELASQWDVEIARQTLAHYDPRFNAKLGPEWLYSNRREITGTDGGTVLMV